MLRLRIEIITRTLKSSDTDSIELMFYTTLTNKIKEGVKLKRILKFVPTLEADIRFELQKETSEKERRNLQRVLKIIKEEIDVNLLKDEQCEL